jgi:hypothetical protein
MVESLEVRRERNLIVVREFFGSAGIRTMEGMVNDRRPDPSPLEERLAVTGTGARIEVLIVCFGLARHGASLRTLRHDTSVDMLRDWTSPKGVHEVEPACWSEPLLDDRIPPLGPEETVPVRRRP